MTRGPLRALLGARSRASRRPRTSRRACRRRPPTAAARRCRSRSSRSGRRGCRGPRPQAVLLVSCAPPGVRPPSPSTTKTLTSSAPASFSASASPAAGRHAVAGRPGVELQEERLALHLGVAGQAAAAPQPEQVLPGQRPLAVVGEGEARRRASRSCAGAHDLVEHGQRRVDRAARCGRPTSTNRSPNGRHGRRMSQRIAPRQQQRQRACAPWSASRPGGRSGGSSARGRSTRRRCP